MPEEKRFLTPPQVELKGKSLLMSQNIPNFLPSEKQKEALQSPEPNKYLGGETALSQPRWSEATKG